MWLSWQSHSLLKPIFIASATSKTVFIIINKIMIHCLYFHSFKVRIFYANTPWGKMTDPDSDPKMKRFCDNSLNIKYPETVGRCVLLYQLLINFYALSFAWFKFQDFFAKKSDIVHISRPPTTQTCNKVSSSVIHSLISNHSLNHFFSSLTI